MGLEKPRLFAIFIEQRIELSPHEGRVAGG
jgi:hypothetical protein